ncbi:MAG: uroporphyrinogen-III C-methyltransferase [Sphingobacteriia bacterium]|nr:uroporphyrinogen-III C-methyltransferase [Sphingobacteriia bacterium]
MGQANGKVILAGAGCGDPDLITVKAAKYLQQADVVLTDRLVSDDILRNYVNESTEVVYVGKQCRLGASTPQETINHLLIQYAEQGKLVVRLKGGDVSIFSNILDELEVLVARNIPYEIIPGVTAALGAAAHTGIPLTARGYATAVRLLTYYKSDVVTDEYWRELSDTNDTLVFYMSSETLPLVVEKLKLYNISNEKKIAVVEQATTPLQKVHISSFAEYDSILAGKKFLSPSLIIIGRVVALHEQFAWLQNSVSDEYYFRPVAQLNTSSNNKVKQKKERA